MRLKESKLGSFNLKNTWVVKDQVLASKVKNRQRLVKMAFFGLFLVIFNLFVTDY